MEQVTIYSPGDIGSSGTPWNLTTAPGTLQTRIMPEKGEPNVESTCLSLGGKIEATVSENTHVDSVGPEPGVGYGWSGEYKDHHPMKPSGRAVQSEAGSDGRYGGAAAPEKRQ